MAVKKYPTTRVVSLMWMISWYGLLIGSPSGLSCALLHTTRSTDFTEERAIVYVSAAADHSVAEGGPRRPSLLLRRRRVTVRLPPYDAYTPLDEFYVVHIEGCCGLYWPQLHPVYSSPSAGVYLVCVLILFCPVIPVQQHTSLYIDLSFMSVRDHPSRDPGKPAARSALRSSGPTSHISRVTPNCNWNDNFMFTNTRTKSILESELTEIQWCARRGSACSLQSESAAPHGPTPCFWCLLMQEWPGRVRGVNRFQPWLCSNSR